jgi:gas vesicle protein
MNSGKVFLGILVGVAVGATMGILFAPDKGSKTRNKIIRKKDEFADEMHEKFNEFMDGITQKFEKVQEAASRKVNKVVEETEDVEAEVITAVKGKRH